MSGGVDSSVVAHLLKREGHEVIAVRFTLWSDPLAPPLSQILPSKCCNAQTAFRAKKVAEDLRIPLHILNLEEEFKREVVDPFLEGYKKGLTPNPCIGCNRTVKFGKLLSFMRECGCDALATGHYARVSTETLSDGSRRHILLEAVDATKDQSYYLYGLTQEQLMSVLFPLGNMLKSDVFSLAEQFRVPYDARSYRESQDLCFFPEKTPEAFLKRHIPDMKPGPIRLEDGRIVGEHEGIPLYTIGQRRGIGIGGLKIPLHVIRKDATTNSVYVAPKGSGERSGLTAVNLRWISWVPAKGREAAFDARIHSLGERRRGMATHDGKTLKFRFDKPLFGISPGQSVVLYRGPEVVGGGVISEGLRDE